jgi:hypothetical protein
MRLDAASIRKQFAGVLEHDHAIAEQAPTLLGMADEDTGCVPVAGVGTGARWLVLAHFVSPVDVALVTVTRGARYSSERCRYEQVTPL